MCIEAEARDILDLQMSDVVSSDYFLGWPVWPQHVVVCGGNVRIIGGSEFGNEGEKGRQSEKERERRRWVTHHIMGFIQAVANNQVTSLPRNFAT